MGGELPGRDAAALERHLASCASCRVEVERMGASWRALERIAAAPSAPDDWARIEAALDRRRPWLPAWLDLAGALRPAAAGAFAVLVALGAAGGTLVSRAALEPRRHGAIEADAFAEVLGELPWGSPVSGLAASLAAAGRER